jgi:hypothetical protein
LRSDSKAVSFTDFEDYFKKEEGHAKKWAMELVSSFKKLVKLERRSPSFEGNIFISHQIKDLVKFYLKKNYQSLFGDSLKTKFEALKK